MTTDTTSQIIKRLIEQEKEEGNLSLLLQFYLKLLNIQYKARQRIGRPGLSLSREAIDQRVLRGLPLVSFEDLELDWTLVQDVFAKVTALFTRYPALFGEIPEQLKKADAGHLLTKKAVKAWFTGKELPPALLEDIRENLMQTFIQITLQPFLANYSEALISLLDQNQWRRRYCPICGGTADLAFLEKEYGARWLKCSRCDAEWLFQRLVCPCCGTTEQTSLSFFTDETELYRLYVCDQCKSYLKVIDLRKVEKEVLLPLERFYTLDLDSQAKAYGYHPCQRSAMKRY